MLISMATQTRSPQVLQGAAPSNPVSQVGARTVPKGRPAEYPGNSGSNMFLTPIWSLRLRRASTCCSYRLRPALAGHRLQAMAISDDRLPMRTIQGHTGPDHVGGTFFPADVVRSWCGSSLHRRGRGDSSRRRVGVALLPVIIRARRSAQWRRCPYGTDARPTKAPSPAKKTRYKPGTGLLRTW